MSEFVALTKSVVQLLESIPELTQMASAAPGQDPFLAIRAGETDVDVEDFVHRHQATFMMDTDVEAEHAFFWSLVQAETWHDGPEPGTGLATGWTDTDWHERVNTMTRHELGPYKPSNRVA